MNNNEEINEEKKEENENENENVDYVLPINNEIKEDQFSEEVENKYHLINFLDSINSLKYESIICQKIIDYKKNNNFDDVEIWENKKFSVDLKLKNKQDMISVEIISLKDYCNEINKQLKVEEKHLNKIKEDKNVKPYEIFALKERINKRIELIKDELKQIQELIENENKEKEEEENKKKEENNNENNNNENNNNENNENNNNENNNNENNNNENNNNNNNNNNQKIDKNLILNLIDKRLDEYKQALIYFNKNNLIERQKLCYKDALKISEIKKNIENNNFSNVNEIPKQINPEYIYGYSNKEREEKFKEIFKYLIIKKNDEHKKLINFTNSIKKIDKEKLKKIESQIIKDIDSLKKKIKTYDELIQKMQIICKDEWIPAPLFEIKEEKTIKINKQIEENNIVIHLGKTNFNDNKIIIECAAKFSENCQKIEKNIIIKDKKTNNFDHTIKWNLNYNDWKNAVNKKVFFILLNNNKKKIGNFIIDLCELKSKSIYKNNVKINLDNKSNENYLIEIIILLREPFVDKEYEKDVNYNFQITKIFPSFKEYLKKEENKIEEKKISSNNNNNINNNNINNNNNNIQQPKKINNNLKNQNKPIEKELPKPSEFIDPSTLNEKEKNDPGNEEFYQTLYATKNALDTLEMKIQKIDGRTPKPLLNKKIKLGTYYQFLKENIGTEIQLDKYKIVLNNGIQRDKKLMNYFLQIKDREKYEIVLARLNNEIKEFKELQQM